MDPPRKGSRPCNEVLTVCATWNPPMISRIAAVSLFSLAMWLLVACQAAQTSSSAHHIDAAVATRNQGYALLYSTIEDESRLDQTLIIKNPSPQVKDLLIAIAQFAGTAKQALQAHADADPSLDLKIDGLPAMETKTRKAISGSTTKQVLFSSGKEFEFTILLTQHEALNYITHLAAVLARQESNEARKTYLNSLAKESGILHARVIALLKAPNSE